MTPVLTELLKSLEDRAPKYQELNLYYRAEQDLAFLSPESKRALGNRFGRIASNIPRLAINSLAERMRVTGFVGADVFDEWVRLNLDQLSGVLHREALTLGQAACIVWASADGKPLVTVESAEQVAFKRDPATREVVAACKRWRDSESTHAVLYLPDVILHYRADSPSATTSGFVLLPGDEGTIPNPLGVVPVVPFTNSDRLLDEDGRSEIEDLKPLTNGLAKTLADLAVAQEFTARPRRWATGIELVERPVLDDDGVAVTDPDTGEVVTVTENPIPEGNRAMVAEEKDAKFGQLEGASLAGYEAAVKIWLGQLQAVSALPGHLIGTLTDAPVSADSLRASESSLTARAEQKAQTFGRSWETVAKLIVAVRDGVDPADVDVRVEWADASTRSQAQESDAAVKLYQAGILSRTAVLRRLGYNDEQIKTELGAIKADAEDARDIVMGRVMSGVRDR